MAQGVFLFFRYYKRRLHFHIFLNSHPLRICS